MNEQQIRDIAQKFGAYCEPNKPALLEDLDLVAFANYLYDIGWSAGEEFMAGRIKDSEEV